MGLAYAQCTYFIQITPIVSWNSSIEAYRMDVTIMDTYDFLPMRNVGSLDAAGWFNNWGARAESNGFVTRCDTFASYSLTIYYDGRTAWTNDEYTYGYRRII